MRDFILFHSSPQPHYESLIDGIKFYGEQAVARDRCLRHIQALVKSQDGDVPQGRTLSERKNLFIAMTYP